MKFWIRDNWQDWIYKHFCKLPSPFHYRFVDAYLEKEAKRGNANYFIELIKSFDRPLDKAPYL